MKRKILLSPLIIAIIVIIFGAGIAGAAIYFGTTSGGETNTEGINLQKGLVGHWKFDGNAKDATANSKHGTLNGDAAVTATDRKGQVNKAATFDGTGDYVNVGSVLASSGAFSVSAWFKPDNLGDWRTITGAGCTPGFDITVQNDDIYYGRNCGGGNFYTIYDKVSAGQWYNIIVVFDGTNTNAYLNNVKYTGGAESYNNAGRTVYIGSYNGSGEFFNGSIDDVRIYNRALSATEITALYQEYDPGIVISDLQKGLVGHWKLDGNAKDSTANSNHGTVTGAVLTTDRKGQVNKAYSFNGTSDYIDAGSGASLDVTNAITIEAWVKWNSDTRSVIVSKQVGDGKIPYHFRIDETSSKLRFATYYNATEYGLTSNNALSLSEWTHVAITFDKPNLHFFINGVDDGLQNFDHTLPTNSTSLYIGRYGSTYSHSILDDVRIYNRALSATEITALYQEYDPGIVVSDLQKGLVGNWKMNGNAKDSTANSNHGTVTGATLTTDRKEQLNKAYSFDGDQDYVDAGNGASLNPGTGDFAYGFWAKSSQANNWINILGKANKDYSYSPLEGWVITIRSDLEGKPVYYTHTDFNNKVSWGIGQFFQDGLWHHWVFVGNRAAGTVELFKDGVSQGTQSPGGSFTTANITTTSNLTIGCSTNCATYEREYNGSIDDVRVYNRVLSQAEITALYESY